MELGAFSISLAVKDIETSRRFYDKFGFNVFAGDASQSRRRSACVSRMALAERLDVSLLAAATRAELGVAPNPAFNADSNRRAFGRDGGPVNLRR
jgi:hypothetical protein